MSLSDDEFLEMRRAFRDMQDEEPPAGGLASLMAAARTKAAEMAPPKVAEPEKIPWWRALLRPPVLALASVVVLVGGAVLIGRHDETKAPAEPVAQSVAPTASKEAPTPALEATLTAPGAAPTGAAAGSGASNDVAPDRKPADAVERQPREVATDTGKDTDKYKAEDKKLEAPPPPPAPPPPVPIESTARPDPAPGSTPAHKPVNAPTLPSPPPEDDAKASKKDVAGAEGGKQTATGSTSSADEERAGDTVADAPTRVTSTRRGQTAKTPTVDQLVSQCQSAANRNDCQTVKLLAKTIEKKDPSSYRERVQKNDAINRCLK